MLQLLPSDDMCQGTLVLTDQSILKGYLQKSGTRIAFRKRPSLDPELFEHQQITALEIKKTSHKLATQAEKASARGDYTESITIYNTILDDPEFANDPYFNWQLLRVERINKEWQKLQQSLVRNLRSGTLADIDTATTALLSMTTRATDLNEIRDLFEKSWHYRAARLSPDDRQQLAAIGKKFRLRLTWDSRSNESLAAGRTAYQEKNYRDAASKLAHAIAKHAAYETEDLLNLIDAEIKSKKIAQAQERLMQLDSQTAKMPRVRDMKVAVDLIAPPTKPKILTFALFGGPGDQAFSYLKVDGQGNITASATENGGFSVSYKKDGTQFIAARGKIDDVYETQGIDYSVKKQIKNPYDKKTWKIGYKQVAKLLQQPYLYSPHDWQWWGWSNSEAIGSGLAADSRGIDLWFPNAKHFIAMAWTDGGNSSINRHPQSLGQKEPFGNKGYGGNCTKIFLGDQVSGELLNAYMFENRVSATTLDRYGRLYVAGKPAFKTRAPRPGKSSDTTGIRTVTIFDENFQPTYIFDFPIGNIISLLQHENKLILAGTVNPEKISKFKQTNPTQLEPGGGRDAVIGIIELWQK